jgi:hypothetical protein
MSGSPVTETFQPDTCQALAAFPIASDEQGMVVASLVGPNLDPFEPPQVELPLERFELCLVEHFLHVLFYEQFSLMNLEGLPISDPGDDVLIVSLFCDNQHVV